MNQNWQQNEKKSLNLSYFAFVPSQNSEFVELLWDALAHGTCGLGGDFY